MDIQLFLAHWKFTTFWCFLFLHNFPHFCPLCTNTHKMKFLKPAPSGGLLATKTEDIPLESHTPHMVVSIYSSFLLSPSQGWDSNCKHVVPQLSYRTIYALGRYYAYAVKKLIPKIASINDDQVWSNLNLWACIFGFTSLIVTSLRVTSY